MPFKNKTEDEVLLGTKLLLDVIKPEVLTTDLGSEYVSKKFKNLMEKHGIEHRTVPKFDHHRLWIVDRFIRTLRTKIEKYLIMHNTSNYFDVLPQIMESYNTSFHAGIKNIPEEVGETDEKVNQMYLENYLKAVKPKLSLMQETL